MVVQVAGGRVFSRCQQMIGKLDTRIEAAIAPFAEQKHLLTSIPGVGERTARWLLHGCHGVPVDLVVRVVAQPREDVGS